MNYTTQYYKGIPLQLIDRKYKNMKAKRYTLNGTNQNVWIPNKHLLEDGTIIEIAGNTDPNPSSDPTDEYNIKLSKQRAEAVKQYFILNGISADRIVTVGNGSSNPVADNGTSEGRAKNRRTDVSFKCIEQ